MSGVFFTFALLMKNLTVEMTEKQFFMKNNRLVWIV